MKVTAEHNECIARMKFSSVYPHYVIKVEKKERIAKSHRMANWL